MENVASDRFRIPLDWPNPARRLVAVPDLHPSPAELRALAAELSGYPFCAVRPGVDLALALAQGWYGPLLARGLMAFDYRDAEILLDASVGALLDCRLLHRKGAERWGVPEEVLEFVSGPDVAGILAVVVGGEGLTLRAVDEVMGTIQGACPVDAHLLCQAIVGAGQIDDGLVVTVSVRG